MHKNLFYLLYVVAITMSFTMCNSQSRTYIAIGDSITTGWKADTPYQKILGSSLNLKLQPLAENKAKVFGVDGFLRQAKHLPDNFDGLITIMIGINDAADSIPLGSSIDALNKPFDHLQADVSFAESFRLGLEIILRKSPNSTVITILPLKSSVDETILNEYRQVEREICDFYAVPVADIYRTCYISPLTFQELMPDKFHPNDAGHIKIAQSLFPIIEMYFPR